MALSLTGDHVFAVNHEYSLLLCLQNTRVSLSWRVTRVWMDGCFGLDEAIQVRENMVGSLWFMGWVTGFAV